MTGNHLLLHGGSYPGDADANNPPQEDLTEIPMMRAALAYAKRGIPVFPLKTGDKTPAIKKCQVAKRHDLTGSELAEHARTCKQDGHGFHDATTDPDQIRRWWRKHPEANIGIPTGERSGRIVVDVDPDAGGYDSLDALHERGLVIPSTRTIRTGGEVPGLHFYLLYPERVEIRNSAGKLGPGLDIRGEGGYVVAPPSVTTGPYEFLHDRPIADTPDWLIEALTGPSSVPDGHQDNVVPMGERISLEGPEIPTSKRNTTLYKIACSLRARGHGKGEILDALEGVNRERCSTPLAEEELSKIAGSAARHAPGNARPEVSPEVLEAVAEVEADIMRRDWPGVGGKSDRDAMLTLCRLARMHGEMIPAGVRVSVDIRTWALMSSVSKRALLDNNRGGERRPGVISRLKAGGLIRADNGMRRHGEAGAFVLLPPAQRCTTRTTGAPPLVSKEPGVAVGAQLRTPLTAAPTAPRMRWSRPLFDGATRVGTLSRLGKSKGAVVDHLEASPSSSLTIAELAELLGMSRVRDLRRRHLEPLETAGVVECSGDAVALTPDWLLALNERRDQDGEIADHRRDMARYERERQAYRERKESPPSPHPANAGADGYVEDLEVLPDPPEAWDLYPLVNTTVNTRQGPGTLWQVMTGRAGVVLDSDPSKVTFMDPSELLLEGVAA